MAAGIADAFAPQIQEELRSRGMCALPEDEVELDDLVRQGISVAQSGGPVSLMELLVTQRCNLACSYCWVKPTSSGPDMSLEVALAAIDCLLTASLAATDLEITFFGGEPLLRFDLIRVLMPYAVHRAKCVGKNVTFSITTNGTLVTEEVIETLDQFGTNPLISIDGPRGVHDKNRRYGDGRGSFDDVMKAVKLLNARGKWVGARLTVHPDFVQGMTDAAQFLIDAGVNQIILGWVDDVSWPVSRAKLLSPGMSQLADIYKRCKRDGVHFRQLMFESDERRKCFARRGTWGCRAGRNCVSVAPDGFLYPCAKTISSECEHLDRARLGTVWEGITAFDTRRRWLRPPPSFVKVCAECEAADFCTGGCPAVRFRKNGHPWKGRSETCNCVRELAKALRDIFGEDPFFQEQAEANPSGQGSPAATQTDTLVERC